MDRYPSRVVRICRMAPWSGSPLMRRSDRVQGLVGVFAVALGAAAVVAAVLAGAWAHTSAQERIRSDAASKVVVTGVVTSDPVRMSAPDAGTVDQAQARVRWGDGPRAEEATADVPGTARVGDRVPVWLDRDGRPALPPADAGTAVVAGVGFGLLALIAAGSAVGALAWAAGRVIDARRAAAWAEEWRRFGTTRHENH